MHSGYGSFFSLNVALACKETLVFIFFHACNLRYLWGVAPEWRRSPVCSLWRSFFFGNDGRRGASGQDLNSCNVWLITFTFLAAAIRRRRGGVDALCVPYDEAILSFVALRWVVLCAWHLLCFSCERIPLHSGLFLLILRRFISLEKKSCQIDHIKVIFTSVFWPLWISSSYKVCYFFLIK